nr:NDP-sugar synthase [Blastocatellia bacterium]
MKAMILAAGFGTRLFPLTIDRTKPAVPFLNKPLVGYVAEYLARFGFREVIVNLHHQPESVIAALGDGSSFGVSITYSEETPDILGTSGALDHVRDQLSDDAFLVINGKIITDIDLSAAVVAHKASGAIATMVLMRNEKRERFTEVEVERGLVSRFGEFPSPDRSTSSGDAPLMFTGIQILEPRVFDYIPRGVYSDIIPSFYQPAIDSGERIASHIAAGKWYEMSTIPRYLDISLAMMDGADVCIGERCSLAPSATVHDAVIWDDVIVPDDVALNRVIVADGVQFRSGDHYENAAIVRADMVRRCTEIPTRALPGFE